MRAIFVKATALTKVKGRIRYITNATGKQEHLYAVSGNLDMEFWNQLAKESQETFKASGNDRLKKMKKKDGTIYYKQQRACEAREIVINMLDIQEDEAQSFADQLVTWFRETYGVDCCVAIHNNKKQTNKHAHIIFAERELMPEREIKIATRNTWVDEKGRQRKAKSDILDENGELRPDCRVIKKGEEIYSRTFFDKRTEFGAKWHLDKMKQDVCDWTNEFLQPDEKKVVFDPFGPYLAQQKIGKGNENQERIERYNRNVQHINAMIDNGEISKEEAYEIKDRVMSSPDRNTALEDAVTAFEDSIEQENNKWYSETIYPKANKKQQLYRNSNVAWNNYKEAKAAGAPKEIVDEYLSAARHASAELDRYKRDNGLYQDKDYIKLIKSYKNKIAQKKAEIERCKNQEKKAHSYFSNYRKKYSSFDGEEIDIADEKYWNLKRWWADCIRKTARAKKELKALKEEFKAVKKEFRQHKKNQKTTKKSGFESKIQSAAERSGSPGTTKTKEKER